MTSPRQVASACASGAADQHPLRPHQMTTGAANGGRKHRSIRREPDQLADRDHGPTVGVFPACDIKNSGELAEKEPETYLPDVAATLNDLGIFDSDQNRIEKARKEFEEALKTYRELAHKEPDIYLRYVAIALNNLGILEGAKNYLEEALKIYRELTQKERET